MASNAPILRRMHLMVPGALNILIGNSCLDEFGELLHEGWMLKRSLGDGVTNPHIDNIYDTARAHGAIGGKLLGAGKAGFVLLFVPPGKQRSVRGALAQYLWAPFSFEFGGSKIIYDDKEVMQRYDD
jgi:D-glycero-alpha-D-manno-heptose-7-phosphate kinase